MVNNLIYAKYNYCPLVWCFCSQKLMNKIEKIQYRALHFINNHYDYDYNTFFKRNQINVQWKYGD